MVHAGNFTLTKQPSLARKWEPPPRRLCAEVLLILAKLTVFGRRGIPRVQPCAQHPGKMEFLTTAPPAARLSRSSSFPGATRMVALLGFHVDQTLLVWLKIRSTSAHSRRGGGSHFLAKLGCLVDVRSQEWKQELGVTGNNDSFWKSSARTFKNDCSRATKCLFQLLGFHVAETLLVCLETKSASAPTRNSTSPKHC